MLKSAQLSCPNRSQGLSQVGPCNLGARSSANSTCTLVLAVSAETAKGPIVCQIDRNGQDNPNECYRSADADSLAV